MDIGEKKRYLNEYRFAKKKEARLREQILILREQATSPSVKLDGMPKGGGDNDLSGYAAKLDGLLRMLEDERKKQVDIYTDIYRSVQMLSDPLHCEVLERRYLMLQPWRYIAREMHYDERQVFRIHGRALRKIEFERCQ